MTDPPRDPDAKSRTGRGTDHGTPPGVPRWVKVSGIVVGILVLALVAIMFISGADHGPSRHATGHRPTGQIEQKALGDETLASHHPSDWGHG